jgi:hypothetical protein
VIVNVKHDDNAYLLAFVEGLCHGFRLPLSFLGVPAGIQGCDGVADTLLLRVADIPPSGCLDVRYCRDGFR